MRITAISRYNYCTPKTPCRPAFSGNNSSPFNVINDIKTVKYRGGSVPEGVEKLALAYKDSNLRLADVHKMYYSGLLDCKTLDEAKEKYPEFKNVKQLNEVESRKNGTLYFLQNGLVTGFDKDDDVSLRLLQEHWVNMRAVQDLPGIYHHKTSHCLLNFESVYSKLDIPKMNRQYVWEVKK